MALKVSFLPSTATTTVTIPGIVPVASGTVASTTVMMIVSAPVSISATVISGTVMSILTNTVVGFVAVAIVTATTATTTRIVTVPVVLAVLLATTLRTIIVIPARASSVNTISVYQFCTCDGTKMFATIETKPKASADQYDGDTNTFPPVTPRLARTPAHTRPKIPSESGLAESKSLSSIVKFKSESSVTRE
uniref:Uncharacterized protein n=1 Tax=Anopheles culicifacies TaxID=139723 RepID=A0A182MVG9_9DIPT